MDALRALLQLPAEGREQSESNLCDASSPLTHLNAPIDSSGFTLLHVATAAAQKAAIRLLLDMGADPSCRYKGYCEVKVRSYGSCARLNYYSLFLYRDNKGQTPYIVAPDKDTRSIFRKFMGENPDKYDYSKAQVRLTFLTRAALNAGR